MTLIECIPNFSEGRRLDVVDKLAAAAASVDGVTVLDQQSDATHNRCVITFVGDEVAIGDVRVRKGAGELGDDGGGDRAADGMFAQDGRVEVQKFHGGPHRKSW